MTVNGVPARAHTDIVRKARDLMVAHRTTRDILLDRSEPSAPQLVARKRKLFDLFRKKPDPFVVTPAKFDAWLAEIDTYHPSRADLWREATEMPRNGVRAIDLPGVAPAAEKQE